MKDEIGITQLMLCVEERKINGARRVSHQHIDLPNAISK